MSDADQFSYPNTRCVRKACDALGIPYQVHDAYGNLVAVDLDPVHFFVNAATPFNSSAIDRLCKDKEFTWKLLHGAVRMPRTKGYFDPYPNDPSYANYVKEPSYDAIADAIVHEFTLPVIVKMNAGLQGKNVYRCNDRAAILEAVTKILDHERPFSDYIVLAQDYIESVHEYRAIVFRGHVVLLYEKDVSRATFKGNLSPLHYEGSRAVHIEDAASIARVEEAIAPLFPILDLEFGGIDLIKDSAGMLHLIELNTYPGFNHFVKDNGDEPLVAMYMRILRALAP